MRLLALAFPLSLAAGCPDPAVPNRTPLVLVAGAPQAGAAEGLLDIPVGAPMGGYSSRCDYLGGDGAVDKRQSAYVNSFTPTVGIQTAARGKVVWLYNGDQDLVVYQIDAIYSFSGLVEALETKLGALSGRDLDGRVVVATSHTHHAPANFSKDIHFFLGGDRYNEEVFQRLVGSMEAMAEDALAAMQPAAIGVGVATDWDPNDLVYRDRRGENDKLEVWDDAEPGMGKDPILWLLRVDTAAGEPLALFYDFGIHGTVLDGDNPLVSADATGGIEWVVADAFDTPVVVAHLQGGGGDASPSGDNVDRHPYARLEALGDYAVDAIIGLREATPTSTAPFLLETISHSIPEERDQIHVTRNGTMDLYYAPFDATEGYQADDIVYDDNGNIISPIDEFNGQYGGVFCGSDEPLISTGTIGSTVPPYDGCMDVELISWVLTGIFELDEEDVLLPLPDSTRAGTTVSRLGPVSLRKADGTVVEEDVLIGFLPGETTAMYVEQWRRRTAAELGFENSFVVGYAQDHEGYLLIPEDWLVGGYEPNINVWGPLQAEHIMEGAIDAAQVLLTDSLEPQDPTGAYQPINYPDEPLPEAPPDETPSAGTAASEVPENLWIPLDTTAAVAPEPLISRVTGLAQFAWDGGDPGVDSPRVVLEVQDEATGDWAEVTTSAGRPIDQSMPDILLVHTPDPLYPWDDTQTHTWWAGWQAVGHVHDRVGLPTGTYRLHVTGNSYSGGSSTWPWAAEPYDIASDPFEVVEATLTLTTDGAGSVSASLDGPAWGYRLLGLLGRPAGQNPVPGATLWWEMEDGSLEPDAAVGVDGADGTSFAGTEPEGAVAAVVVDPYGNEGRIALAEAR
jgi:neutral ceramidase